MADHSPGGAISSFAGTSIPSITSVASIGFPSVDRAPVEAYVQTLGSVVPVDLFNGTASPRRDTVALQVLIRASDGTTDPVAAWQAVLAAYRTLAGLPEVGVLVIGADAGGGTTYSCTARRKPLPLKLTPGNARHLVVDMSFVCLTEFV